jgi:hypothetical protein
MVTEVSASSGWLRKSIGVVLVLLSYSPANKRGEPVSVGGQRHGRGSTRPLLLISPLLLLPLAPAGYPVLVLLAGLALVLAESRVDDRGWPGWVGGRRGVRRSEGRESAHSLVLRHCRWSVCVWEGEGRKRGSEEEKREERKRKVEGTDFIRAKDKLGQLSLKQQISRILLSLLSFSLCREKVLQPRTTNRVYRSFFRSTPFDPFVETSFSSSSSSPSSSSSLRVSSAGFPRTIPYSTRRTVQENRDQSRSTGTKSRKGEGKKTDALMNSQRHIRTCSEARRRTKASWVLRLQK